MTQGSTGGSFAWAGNKTPTNPNDPAGWGWVGPAITTAAGAVNPLFSAGLGAIGASGVGGFQGTDKGWGNVGQMLLGAGAGYGLGTIGAGLKGGLGAMLSPTATIGAPGTTGSMSIMGQGANFGAPAAGLDAFAGGFGAGSGLSNLGSLSGIGNQLAGGGTPTSATQFPNVGMGPSGMTAGAGTKTGMLGNLFQTVGLTGGAKGGMDIGKMLATGAGVAGMAAEPPTYDYQTAEDRYGRAMETVVGKYMGEAGMQLPQVVQEEYLKMVQTPFGELYKEFDVYDANQAELERTIGQSYDEYDEGIKAQYAQAGGLGSSDYEKAMAKSREARTRELAVGRAQLMQGKFEQAVNIKQEALLQSAKQGQYNSTLALELAKLVGEDQNVKMALEADNYEKFQNSMMKIFQMGTQSPMPRMPNLSL